MFLASMRIWKVPIRQGPVLSRTSKLMYRGNYPKIRIRHLSNSPFAYGKSARSYTSLASGVGSPGSILPDAQQDFPKFDQWLQNLAHYNLTDSRHVLLEENLKNLEENLKHLKLPEVPLNNDDASLYYKDHLSSTYGLINEIHKLHPELDVTIAFLLQDKHNYAHKLLALHKYGWRNSNPSKNAALTCLSKLMKAQQWSFVGKLLSGLIEMSFSDTEISYLVSYMGSLSRSQGDHWSRAALSSYVLKRCQEHDDEMKAAVSSHNVKSTVPTVKPIGLMDMLVNISLSTSPPLVSTSIAYRLCTRANIRHETLHMCFKALTIDIPTSRLYQLSAIFKLLHKAKQEQFDLSVVLTGNIKRRIIELSLRVAIATETEQTERGNYWYRPVALVSEPFYQCCRIGGGLIDVRTCYEVILYFLEHDSFLLVSRTWKYVSKMHGHMHFWMKDYHTITKLIQQLSKNKRTLAVARSLVGRLPEEAYHLEGLTEAILIYCARDHNTFMANKVLSVINTRNSVFRRPVLSALLQLHLSMGNEEEASAISDQIVKQGSTLFPEDIVQFTTYLQPFGIEKVLELLEASPGGLPLESLLQSLGTAIKAEIDQESYKLSKHVAAGLPSYQPDYFLYSNYIGKLLKSHQGSVRRLAYSIVLQKYSYEGEDEKARHFWQKIQLQERNKAIAVSPYLLNSILPGLLFRNSIKTAAWLFNQYRCQGVTYQELLHLVTIPASFQRLPPNRKDEWVSLIKSTYKLAM